ncbi:N-acetylmuramoyl-L-alanine amidase [Cytobacillus oceanisediminis]|uniref:N-acetylmuramoyl-L-alanine amidase n=1 Tax=Cytobacillus oceanisediminis TaxID=665099 RepID=UPI003736A943
MKFKKICSAILTFSLTASLLAVPASFSTASVTTQATEISFESSSLQKTFEKAAKEFGVSESVLLAVAYNQTRWEQHEGQSEAGGYGIMNLVDLPADLSARGKHDDGLIEAEASSISSLNAAAKLLDADPETLKKDSEQNIRGGAALLAEYARQTTGELPSDPADWYGAVVKFSGTDQEAIAKDFADQVYATIQQGAERKNHDGQRVALNGQEITPNKNTASSIPLRNTKYTNTDCPNGLDCTFIPAAYKQFSSSAGNYGNYDIANRPEDDLDIRYIIIHDIEGSAQSAISHFQNQSYVSAHYVIDSATGKITQMVRPEDVPWHAGNWYFNMHSIGLEHEGFAAEGADWYSEQMYRSTAKLVKYLSERFGIPLDRQHIIGHDEIPGLTAAKHRGMHWDPGAYWDWGHFFDLLGASINPSDGDKDSDIVTIRPNYNTNQPDFTYRGIEQELESSSLIHLYREPSFDAPLVRDPVLHSGGNSTRNINDWGNKAAIGQSFYKAGQEGDWTAIYYGGQKAWFYNPNNTNSVPGSGTLITPKEGLDSIPVYGAAYPDDAAYDEAGIAEWARGKAQVLYQMPAGQIYTATAPIQSDYYHAKYYNDPATNKVVKGNDEYYQIFYNHRLGFVKKSDVEVVK